MALTLSGLASGFDWNSLVDQLIEVERIPEQRMKTEQSAAQQRNNAYSSIQTQLQVVQNRLDDLSDSTLFDSRMATSSDTSIGSVSVEAGAPEGNYLFEFSQLASAASKRGSDNVGKSLNPTNDVSGLVLSSAGFSSAITAGSLTVNGKQLSIETSDTLESVFNKINTATSGAVTGSYDASTDQIKLTSAAEIVLGSSNDTSNFFQAAKLYNSGGGQVVSTGSLGGVKLTSSMATANLNTAINDGGSGTGKFKVNGVEISFNASTDSIRNVLDRINASDAGVTATYDGTNDRFLLTNKASGDVGIALEDVSGNFLAATGISGGTLVRGQNLLYKINGGEQMVSRSNTVTEATSGLPGLTVTALTKASVSISVSTDTSAIKSKIKDFIADYNKAQSLIDTNTASSTDADGKVTAGVLAGEADAYAIASQLRSLANVSLSSLTAGYRNLADMGINSNGDNNSLSLDDESKLTKALTDNLDAVKKLFTDSKVGLAVKLSEYVKSSAGEEGTLATKQDNLTKESARIDTQIADYERVVQAQKERLVASFVAMETAQSNINNQLQYLMKQFS